MVAVAAVVVEDAGIAVDVLEDDVDIGDWTELELIAADSVKTVLLSKLQGLVAVAGSIADAEGADDMDDVGRVDVIAGLGFWFSVCIRTAACSIWKSNLHEHQFENTTPTLT